MRAEKWVAVDEVGNDNFATSIYENDFDGLLVARCNQNGSYPWQAPAIIRGLEKNKGLPVSLEEIVEVLEELLAAAEIDEKSFGSRYRRQRARSLLSRLKGMDNPEGQ